jgi:hypothetical protein
MKEIDLSGIVAEHIDAINAGDTDRAVATFAEDAYVDDNRRIFLGIDAIRRRVAKEMVGDKVTIEVREVLDHYGDTMLRLAYDATFDTHHLGDAKHAQDQLDIDLTEDLGRVGAVESVPAYEVNADGEDDPHNLVDVVDVEHAGGHAPRHREPERVGDAFPHRIYLPVVLRSESLQLVLAHAGDGGVTRVPANQPSNKIAQGGDRIAGGAIAQRRRTEGFN